MSELSLQEQANKYAHGAIAGLREMLDALAHAQECDGTTTISYPCTIGSDSDKPETWHDEDAAREVIEMDPLEISVRSDWHELGCNGVNEEYYILLSTGGPATRIFGLLDDDVPVSAQFEYQDWFVRWTVATDTTPEEYTTMLEYAREHYFGE